MSEIVAKLKARTLELRKARDPLAPTFQMVLADAQGQAKAKGLAEFTEDMAVAAINRTIGGAKETLATAPNDELSQRKVGELEALLPAKVTAEEVKAEAIRWFNGVTTEAAPMTYMGEMMKHLMATYGAALDRAQASAIAKEVLTGGR